MRSNFLILLAVACLTLLTSAADAEFDKKGLVGAWLFDEGKGKEVKDSSDNKLHASFDMGKPKWVKGKFGGGLEFDGKSQATVPDNKLMHLEDFTLSAWMNSPKISGKWQILPLKKIVVMEETVTMVFSGISIVGLFIIPLHRAVGNHSMVRLWSLMANGTILPLPMNNLT